MGLDLKALGYNCRDETMNETRKRIQLTRHSDFGPGKEIWRPLNEEDPVFRHFQPTGEHWLLNKGLDAFTEVANLHGYSVELK